MGQSSAERVKSYRARRKADGLPDATRANSSARYKRWYDKHKLERIKDLPFVGCDGEGAGTDDQGRQLFMLFRMGERELYTGQPLSTYEILDFICDEPPGSILVGFAFGYDATMILRDLSPERQRRLLQPRDFASGRSPFTWWRDFDIEYLPRQYFRVKRVNVSVDDFGMEHREPVKGSTRTIYETFGFFQKSFVKCCADFKVANDTVLADVAATKQRRGGTDWAITQDERDYCALECSLLEDLMTKLRAYCTEADIRPRTWSGAGKLAEALHRKHNTPKAPRDPAMIPWPAQVQDWAQLAYYGGRFEITTVGRVEGDVYEYDINSAYPAAMPLLPCLEHGRWHYEECDDKALPTAELYVAKVSYTSNPLFGRIPFGHLNGFPCRTKTGNLCWPCNSAGVYWSPEITSAQALGHRVTCEGAWVYDRQCDCKMFDWVEPLYDYRKSIGSQGAGYPIKLGINSLYGKLVQRKGHGVYVNMIWGGLITAYTRAKLNAAILSAKRTDDCDVLMIATDAIYTTRPLDLPLGPRLGEWDMSTLPGLFIVQPGLYWSPGLAKRKSRGLSGKFFEEQGRIESFENAWRDYLAALNSGLEVELPSVEVDFDCFIGMRLALARNKPEIAGQWQATSRSISFDYSRKRSHQRIRGGSIVTSPKRSAPPSLAHRDFITAEGAAPWDNANLELADQPDYIDLGPAWKE
jgi:hypothetical protein